MSDFKGGGINTTDYDSYNTKYITQKTEFTDDVYVFGKLYAEFGGDVQSFSTAGVERVRIDKDGQVTINSGDLLIKDNLELFSSGPFSELGDSKIISSLFLPIIIKTAL